MSRLDDYSLLRGSIDGNDPFMRGFDARGAGRSGNQKRAGEAVEKYPWAFDDAQVRVLLLRAFPKMGSSETQKKRALRWVFIIVHYFRMGQTANRVGMQLFAKKVRKYKPLKHPKRGLAAFKKEVRRVEDTVIRIRRAAVGLRTDAKPRSGTKGRPRKQANVAEVIEG